MNRPVQINARLTEAELARLHAAADMRQTTVSALIRQLPDLLEASAASPGRREVLTTR